MCACNRKIYFPIHICARVCVKLTWAGTSWGPRPCPGSMRGMQRELFLQTAQRSESCSCKRTNTIRSNDLVNTNTNVHTCPELTSCPAGILSCVWSCRRWHQPIVQPQYWQRTLCDMWTRQSSSARMSGEHEHNILQHAGKRLWTSHETCMRSKHFHNTWKHSPTAVRNCPPGRSSNDHPSWAWYPRAVKAGSHSQPKSQSSWRNHPKPGSYLHTNTCLLFLAKLPSKL